VIEIHRRDDAKCRLVDHIRCVIAATKTHFQDQHIRRHFRKGEQCRCGRGLELGDLMALNGPVGAFQPINQAGIVHDLSGKPDTFIEPDEMRTGENMHLQPGGLHHGAHEGARGALPVRARHVDDRREPVLWTAQQVERIQNAPERQFYCLWI
jgi:hypothetical protein